ncbi:hypothetical protein EU538_11860 [Candidatus Thorarchaeota archaeon]|jgi:hypothetical protein|nr:MAG: hypothetical protein EU538_11860 [Candidatus Thorarchaeota archaeon]
MNEEHQSISGFLPHLTVFSVLLVLEYWTLTSQAALLLGSGDYGPLVGISVLISLLLIIMVAIGFYSMSKSTLTYKRIVPICLILFVVHMVYIFIEYAVIASNM